MLSKLERKGPYYWITPSESSLVGALDSITSQWECGDVSKKRCVPLASFVKCMLSQWKDECAEERETDTLISWRFKLSCKIRTDRNNLCWDSVPLVASTCVEDFLDFLNIPFLPPFGIASLSSACCSFAAFSISTERQNQISTLLINM